MQHQRLFQHVADGHPRIQRSIRILEDDLHLAPQRAHLAFRQGEQVAPAEPDLARRRLDQPQQQPADRRLAAARFADQRERLPLVQLEAHVVDRANRLEMLDEVLGLQQHAHSGARQQAA
jgi:hypothetical protein